MKTTTLFLGLVATVLTAAAESAPAAAKPPATSTDSANVEARDEIEVHAGTDSSKATVKGALDITNGESGPLFTFSASAPLDKDNDYTQIRTFDGFADGFSFSAGVTARSLPFGGEIGPIKISGITGSFGAKKYTYTDAMSLDEKKEWKDSCSLGGFIGWQVGSHAKFVICGVEFKRGWKEQDKKGVALPPDSSGRVFVRTNPYGVPNRKNESLVSVDYRQRFGTSRFAGGIKFTYDFESSHYGIDVPIMLWSDEKDKRWTGGIQVGYNSEKHEGYGAVIVGTPFKIIPK